MLFEIEFYKTENGKFITLDFLKVLKNSNRELWEQINGTLTKIKDKQFQQMPFSRSLKDGLHEARAHYVTQQARINYAFDEGQKIILLNGYLKNDKRSEKVGIGLGRKLLKELKERKRIDEK